MKFSEHIKNIINAKSTLQRQDAINKASAFLSDELEISPHGASFMLQGYAIWLSKGSPNVLD